MKFPHDHSMAAILVFGRVIQILNLPLRGFDGYSEPTPKDRHLSDIISIYSDFKKGARTCDVGG
jgi:hypothetical protein